ncbi:MAG: flippase-like domain-containing protein [Anaerolineae bacterium]|nr:flippase-like domain-containing protein [Anaerolineae bacterium]
MTKTRLLILVGKLALGLILLIALIEVTGSLQDARELLDLNWYQAWPVLGWTLLLNAIATWRWQILIRQFGLPHIPFPSLLKSVVVGRLVGNSTSQVIGDISARSIYLKSHGVDLKQGGLTIIADKLFEVAFALAVSIVFFVSIITGQFAVCPGCFPLATLGVFAAATWSLPQLLKLFGHLPWIAQRITPLPDFLFDHTRWLLAGLTIIKYGVVVLRYDFILRFCGITNLSLVSVFFGTAWAQVGLMLAFTPGGLGFVEAGWTGALIYFSVANSAISKFLIAQRLLITLSVILLAPLTMAFETFAKFNLNKKERRTT